MKIPKVLISQNLTGIESFMLRLILTVSMSLILGLTACGAELDQPEEGNTTASQLAINDTDETPVTPQETVAGLLKLAEAGEWETYVDDYYGEIHKFKGEGDRNALVSRFREDWGVQVIEALRQVRQIDPRLSADGNEAVFELGDGEFTLYKDETGDWKFNL